MFPWTWTRGFEPTAHTDRLLLLTNRHVGLGFTIRCWNIGVFCLQRRMSWRAWNYLPYDFETRIFSYIFFDIYSTFFADVAGVLCAVLRQCLKLASVCTN